MTKLLKLAIGLACCVVPLCGQAAGPSAVVKSEFVFEHAPFPSAHASSIVETADGLLATWFGGTEERNPDVGIWISRELQGKWQPPIEVANGVQPSSGEGHAERLPCWNPVLFQPTAGPLMLFYKVGPSPSKWWGLVKTSNDNGASWSVPLKLPAGMLGPIKDKPIELSNGDVLCPSSSEDHGWQVHFERFRKVDGPWTSTGPLNGAAVSVIQPTVLKLGGENLLALARSKQKKIFQARSSDLGKTWSAFEMTSLPNPNSGIDAVTLADGRHLLVYNHTAKGRTPLNLAISTDGKTWRAALVLENEPGEYSYPAIIQTKDRLVHITYTWKRQLIKHVIVDPRRLEAKDFDDGAWPTSIASTAIPAIGN
jgi:predicted neuraminidase